MTKLKLLTTTAIFIGVVTVSAVSKAEDNQSWLDTMTQSVQGWFGSKTAETSSDVEMYLDEVTIAVPPMSSDITNIEPAAGDYQETLDEAMSESEEHSFNTGFSKPGEVLNAFGDNMASVDELADIMPAAGDEAPVANAVDAVVAVTEEPSMMEKAADIAGDMMDATIEKASEVSGTVTDAVVETAEGAMDVSSDMVEGAVDAVSEMSADAMEIVEPAAADVETVVEDAQPMTDAKEKMDDAMNDVESHAHDMIEGHSH